MDYSDIDVPYQQASMDDWELNGYFFEILRKLRLIDESLYALTVQSMFTENVELANSIPSTVPRIYRLGRGNI